MQPKTHDTLTDDVEASNKAVNGESKDKDKQLDNVKEIKESKERSDKKSNRQQSDNYVKQVKQTSQSPGHKEL